MTPSKIMIKNNMKISSEIKTQVCTVKLNFITQENEQMLSDWKTYQNILNITQS